jgi:hypothetical protein
MFKRKPAAPETVTFCDVCGARAEKDETRCVLHLGIAFGRRDAVRGESETRA